MGGKYSKGGSGGGGWGDEVTKCGQSGDKRMMD